ncbi:MAG: asparaginase [Pyrinomonadaceae bacterium]
MKHVIIAVQFFAFQPMAQNSSAVLVEVRRGSVIESIHRGHLAIVDGDGELVCALGNPETVTFMRSAAKPFQAIPFVMSGAAERFGLTMSEIAITCGSHSGEPLHTETAAKILAKAGLSEKDLHCGAHDPFNQELARKMIAEHLSPTQLHNNCSGKHAGMLAFAKHIGANIETYELPENPIQAEILKTIESFSDLNCEQISVGVDGCAVPNFAMPLLTMAQMYAKLVFPPKDFDAELREACRRIVSAMMDYPEMIGGSLTERLDTEIMRAASGLIISKIGAEGVYTAGVLPSPRYKRGLGIALKIEDGEDRRARPVATLEILKQLEIINPEKSETLRHFAHLSIKNWRGEQVGEVVPNFTLSISPPN